MAWTFEIVLNTETDMAGKTRVHVRFFDDASGQQRCLPLKFHAAPNDSELADAVNQAISRLNNPPVYDPMPDPEVQTLRDQVASLRLTQDQLAIAKADLQVDRDALAAKRDRIKAILDQNLTALETLRQLRQEMQS
jgi:hypothetical protein